MSVRVRIAPSPTGNLHIGTARTAVFNWLFARCLQGTFVLRIEDTDEERSRPEYTQNILDGLQWLGLNWDEGPFFQSKRLDLYKQAVEALINNGSAYRCYCTSQELEEMREAQKARGEAPRYDNRHRNLTPEQSQAFEAEGRKPVIRFIIDGDRQIVWNDLVRGTVTWRGSDLGGDMIIARSSEDSDIGQPLYNLAVVVDDINMQISHVIRGEDHIANTAKQILLYEAMGASVPEFGHTPLILNQDGRKLSKRDGVTSISDFQKMGYVAPALVNYMTLLGWTPPDATQEIFTLSEAAVQFGFERVNQAGAKFDWDKLNWLNGQYIHKMPVSQLCELLIPFWEAAGYEFDIEGDLFWLEQLTELIGPSLSSLEEAPMMTQMFFKSEVEFTQEAIAQLKQEGVGEVIRAILDGIGEPLSADDAQALIKQVVKDKKVKKGLVMRSLRAALTGSLHGPDLIASWSIWHQRGEDSDRLKQALQHCQ